jgi:hypothetical protein
MSLVILSLHIMFCSHSLYSVSRLLRYFYSICCFYSVLPVLHTFVTSWSFPSWNCKIYWHTCECTTFDFDSIYSLIINSSLFVSASYVCTNCLSLSPFSFFFSISFLERISIYLSAIFYFSWYFPYTWSFITAHSSLF